MGESFDERLRRLREQAEARLGRTPQSVDSLSGTDIKDLIHDYQVHQIELEIQNEELRETQKQLELVRDRYARLFNDAPAGYLIIDETGIIAQTNETFAAMVGRETSDLSGTSLAALIVPTDRRAFHGRYRAFFKNPEGKELVFRLQGPSGNLTVRCVGKLENETPLFHRGVAVKRLLLAVSDISRQARAESILRDREQHLQAILETTQDGFWTLNMRGRVIDVNAAYCGMTGYTRDELRQLSIPDLEALENPRDTEARIKRIIASGSECFETRHRRKDGSLFDVEVSVSYIEAGGGKLVCFCRDITDRKQADQSIRITNEELQKANAEKDKLFSIIAHDLKSPMSGLVTSTEMLANQPGMFSERDFRFLSRELHKNARNTFDLLEDLLQWARMSQGGIDFEPTPTSLDELLNMGLSMAKDLAKSKAIALRRDIDPSLIVLVDQPMIKTVIRNLLFNAIKFTPRQGEIVITARQAEQKVTMSIEDNGMGMDEQMLSSIFTLEKGKLRLGTDGEKGTGLGLVLCKQFIEQHGGRIRLKSRPGQGTTVSFTLPM